MCDQLQPTVSLFSSVKFMNLKVMKAALSQRSRMRSRNVKSRFLERERSFEFVCQDTCHDTYHVHATIHVAYMYATINAFPVTLTLSAIRTYILRYM